MGSLITKDVSALLRRLCNSKLAVNVANHKAGGEPGASVKWFETVKTSFYYFIVYTQSN